MKKASEKPVKQALKKTPKLAAKPKTKQSKTALPVSPSAWMVWEKCVLSLQNVKTAFQLERDEYAKAGTALHKAISDTLLGKEVVLEDSDDAALVRFAVDTAKAEIGTALFGSELSVKVTSCGVSFSGIADVLAETGDTIIVIDFKTGWREVEAEGNSQLKLYAHAEAQNDNTIKKWRGIIINARFNSVSYTGGEIEKDYLSKTAKDIMTRTAKKQHKTGNHCAYCQRLSTCKQFRAALLPWLKPGAIDSITREPERLAEALRLAKPAEKLFETIKKEAQLFIDLGGVIPGVTVEYTAGTRAWPRDLSSLDIAERIGLNEEEMVSTSIVSPAEATRRGADKDAINAIAIRPPRKGFKFV